jgi:hypothetical protein
MSTENQAAVVAESNTTNTDAELQKVEGVEAKTTEPADVSPEPAQESAEEREAKKAAKLEARFARLTREKYELKARLDAMERYNQPKANPQSDESGTDIESLIERKVNEREAKKAEEAFFNKSKTLLEKAAEVGDFDIDDFIPLPHGAADAVVELENPKVLAHLQNNPDEIERLSKMSYARQMAEIGRLEAKLSQPAVVKKSSAPAPITPLSGKKTGELEYRPDMTNEEYDKWTEHRRKLLNSR